MVLYKAYKFSVEENAETKNIIEVLDLLKLQLERAGNIRFSDVDIKNEEE
jgi:hypothetical protein